MASGNEDVTYSDLEVNYKSITCENIPELFLDKLTAKKHFGKFGKINRFILRPKRLSCTVEYENEEDAENAYNNAGDFNGHQFMITFTIQENTHARNTEEWVDPDVQAELEAMGHSIKNQVRSTLPSFPASGKYILTPPKPPKPNLKAKPSGDGILKSDGTGKNDLEAILRKPALDAEEKYRVLDARDKLIRLSTVRTTDITKAVSIKGSCPDMCPEKERFMRIAKQQVSPFEVLEGTRNSLDHRIAIKEYSRSSADQETPLAHELRPENVLKMTMTYLMHKIMGLCDDLDTNLGDWYHFVWDRTRSIRKDITQQELCSLESVLLVEQCARFHIHCAARLVSEDSLIFDQKINTENLTKCLQTLKYMYHDLRLKNIKCVNEPEFRAYVVLLNLGDSNFWWEIKQLPEEIQRSDEVRMAVAIYLAMEGNNYVKFFNLVKRTTYMSACILLRYFTQVRVKAIKTMIKAYTRQAVSIPLKYFSKILAFESDEATITFLNHYGLECDYDRVILDKNAFYIPDVPPFVERSLNVVEAKRQVSVGEAIYGQKLESVSVFENHKPHSSFDEDGYLKRDAWNAEDQQPGRRINNEKKNLENKSLHLPSPDNNLFKVPLSSPISPKQNRSSLGRKSPMEGLKMFPIEPAPPVTESSKSSSIFGDPCLSVTSPSSSGLFSTFSSHGTGFFKAPLKSVSPSKEVAGTSGLFASQSSATTSIFSSIREFNSTENKSFFNDKSLATIPSSSIFGGFVTSDNSSSANQLSSNNSLDNKTFSTFTVPKVSDTNLDKNSLFSLTPGNLSASSNKFEISMTTSIEEENRKVKLEQKRKEEEMEKIRLKEEELKMQKKIEEEKRFKAMQEKIKLRAEQILSEIQDEMIKEYIRFEATELLEAYEFLDRESKNIFENFLNEYIHSTLIDIVNEESQLLSRKQKILRKYFTLWKENLIRRIARRKLIENTPIWLPVQSIEQKASSLLQTHQYEALNPEMMSRYRLGVPNNFKKSIDSVEPIDLFSILKKEFKTDKLQLGLVNMKYLKITLSFPDDSEETKGFYSFLNNWLGNILSIPNKNDEKKYICAANDNIALCIRKVHGIIPRNEEGERITDECDHSDALILIMTCSNIANSKRRLHHIVRYSEINKKIPLAIILYKDCKNMLQLEEIEDLLELNKLIDNEVISTYEIFESSGKNDIFVRDAFVKGFKFLAQYSNYEEKSTLEMQQFSSFLNTTIGDEFWRRLYQTWMINPSFRKIYSNLNQIIRIYNEAIEKMITFIKRIQTENYPQFPKELKEFVPELKFDIPVGVEYFPSDWKESHRNYQIKQFLEKLKLQKSDKNENLLNMDVPEIEKQLLTISENCIAAINKSTSSKFGYMAIKAFLEQYNSETLMYLPHVKRLNLICWLKVLKPIVLGLLSTLWNREFDNLPSHVIYEKLELKQFVSKAWWMEDEILSKVHLQETDEEEVSKEADVYDGNVEEYSKSSSCKRIKLDEKIDKSDLEEILSKGSSLVEKANRRIEKYKNVVTTSHEITRSFDKSLYKQEMNIRHMKRFLQDNM